MTYQKLSDLTTKGQLWSIKVKVIRVWDSINNATDELISMDMILMDEHVIFLLFLFVCILSWFCSTIVATINQQSSTEPSISSNLSPNDDNQIWNFGKPTCRCEHCNAVLWYEERLSPNKHTKKPKFGICCILKTLEKTSDHTTQCSHSHPLGASWTKK